LRYGKECLKIQRKNILCSLLIYSISKMSRVGDLL